MAEDPDFEYHTQLIKSLHYIMTNYALANRPGRWRASSIYVRKEETGEIVHEGVDLDQVSVLMEDLMAALNTRSNEPGIIRAAMAHLNLVMIHPFRDGNGRTARCLQSLVLARNGVLSPVFMSVEEYLGRNTQAYYDVLGLVGGGSWQPDRDSRPWLRFTLTAHLRQARTILQRVKESERMWVELERTAQDLRLPDRSVTALFDAMIGLRVRNATYRAYFDDTSDAITEATATRDLQKLVQADLLEARGERRGRHYVARPGLAVIRHRVVQAREPRDDTDPFATAG
jgi:Fic family protein